MSFMPALFHQMEIFCMSRASFTHVDVFDICVHLGILGQKSYQTGVCGVISVPGNRLNGNSHAGTDAPENLSGMIRERNVCTTWADYSFNFCKSKKKSDLNICSLLILM